MRLVQGMYANARSRVRVGERYSEEFEVKVGVHKGLVFSPLLFITVLEALSPEFCSGVPWEDLYADDLVIIAESLKECVRAWTSCRVQASFHAPSVALEWTATASSATTANIGCTRNAVGSST